MLRQACHPIIRQQQVILKNASTPLTAGLLLSLLAWAWRRRRPVKAWLCSSLLIIVPALLCSSAGIVAGITSSYIISTTDIEVLLSSANCGFWDQAAILEIPVNDPNRAASNVFSAEALQAGQLYAAECYNATSLKDCNTFTSANIQWKTNFTAACPFGRGMRLVPAVQMDTGPMNTNEVFGINFAPESQLTFQKKTTCAPITQDGFVDINEENELNESFALYYYGPTVGVEDRSYTWPVNLNASNVTRSYTIA